MKRIAFFLSMMIVLTLTGCGNSDDVNNINGDPEEHKDPEELIITHTVLSMDSYSSEDFCNKVSNNKFMQNQMGDDETANKMITDAIKTLVGLRKPQIVSKQQRLAGTDVHFQLRECLGQRKTHHPVWTHHLPQCQGWQWTQGKFAVTLCALFP